MKTRTTARQSKTAAPRIAGDVFGYANNPPPVPTLKGPVQLDLKTACLGHDTVERFVEACLEPTVLLESLRKLSKLLLHTLLIILDQGEEVITQTVPVDVSRRNFFLFLQKFIADDLNIKLVIALRKDYFGDFFALLQIDASVKTDVKQFLLADMDRHEVLQAIVLPTVKDAAKFPPGLGAPFDQYKFSFNAAEGSRPGVSEVIAEELFEVVPSGGVLPAMQIVCRELYNEVKRDSPAPWIIDEALYDRGGRVAGRVNGHISICLKGAFERAGLVSGEWEVEERRWREALFAIGHRRPDGTVETDQISAKRFEDLLNNANVKAHREVVILWLLRPECLILRRSSELTADTLQRDTFYSLGHDALGLALHEWKVRETVREREAIQRLRAEKRARQRLLATSLALGLAVLAFVVSVLFLHFQSRTIALAHINALISAAWRLPGSNFSLSIRAATEAVLGAENLAQFQFLPARVTEEAYEFVRRWSGETTPEYEPASTLAGLLASAPVRIRPTTVRPESKVLLLSNTPGGAGPGFLFWSPDEARAEVEIARTGAQLPINFGGQLDTRIPLPGVTENATSPILIRVGGNETDPVVFAWHDGAPQRFKLEDFLALSRRFRKQQSPVLLIMGGLVLLAEVVDGTLTVESFVPNSSATSFQHGVTVETPMQNNVKIAWAEDYLVVIMRPRSTGSADSASNNQSGSAQSQSTNSSDVEKVSVWDLSRVSDGSHSALPQEELNSAIAEGIQRLQQCASKTEKVCPVRYIGPDDSHFLKLAAPMQPPEPEKNIDRVDRLFVMDFQTKRSWDIDTEELDRQRVSVQSTFGRPAEGGSASTLELPLFKRLLDPNANVILGGGSETLLVGFPQARSIEVFRITNMQTNFVGTLYSTTDVERWEFSSDGKVLLGRSAEYASGYIWDITIDVKQRAKELLHISKSGRELVQIACKPNLDLFAEKVSRTLWFDATGLTDGPPPDRCGTDR